MEKSIPADDTGRGPRSQDSPLVTAVAAANEALETASVMNPVFLPTEAKAEVLRTLARVEAQAVEQRLRVMAVAGDVAAGAGDPDIARWLARETHARGSDTARELKLAMALDRDYDQLAVAMRAGEVSAAQAHVIVKALDELDRSRVPRDTIERAEAQMVAYAAAFDPTQLARLGRKLLEVVDPDTAEAEEERKLKESEKHAAEKQRLTLRACGDGLTRVSGTIPDHVAVRLATYLHAFTNPRQRGAGDHAERHTRTRDEDGTPYTTPSARMAHPKKLAAAFAQLLEAIDPTSLPVHGGTATTMVVTISHEHLTQGLGAASITNGVPGDGSTSISAAQARRLACNANIIPVVLGSASEVLDVGRAQRLFTRAQRTALLLRDKTCRAEGCSIPGTWSEAHHLVPWSEGGATDLANAALLCSHHHHRAHDRTYVTQLLPNGDIRYRRRR